mgnify:CR=1 FL=1
MCVVLVLKLSILKLSILKLANAIFLHSDPKYVESNL